MDYKKQFTELFNEISFTHGKHETWSAFITASACAFRNIMPVPDREIYESEYLSIISKFDKPEQLAELLAITELALLEDSNQDFLGVLFTKLGLNDSKKGQIFTPYHISKLMAKMTIREQIDNSKEWFSICDPCLGAGSMLIAAANTYKEMGKDYQTDILFAGQDIDRILALSAYVQLSILGCAGYVVVGDSLMQPFGGDVLQPIASDDTEIWYTPMYFHDIWQLRCLRSIFNN